MTDSASRSRTPPFTPKRRVPDIDPDFDDADTDPQYDPPDFDAVPVNYRHDGWTADKQVLFIRTLAETGTVVAACRAVGMSERSAYTLRDRMDAVSFRNAWDHAIDFAVRRLADVKLDHAINGVPVPVFYQGQQVGEKRIFNDRLAIFILRTRQRERFGKWLENERMDKHPEHAAFNLTKALLEVEMDADLSKSESLERMEKRIEALFGKKSIDNRVVSQFEFRILTWAGRFLYA